MTRLCFRATKAFQQLLYAAPNFQRASDVHIHLGLMCMVNKDIDGSLKVSNAQLDTVYTLTEEISMQLISEIHIKR